MVAGFEAAAGSQRVTFQVQDRHRAQDCCLQCGPSAGQPRLCTGGECHGTGDPAGSSQLGGSERAGRKRGGIRGAESPCQATLVPWGSLGLEISASAFPSFHLSHPFAWPLLHRPN